MPTVPEYTQLLKALPRVRVEIKLTRIVPFLDYQSGSPPSFLYTSGRPNRCNPKDVNCIYFSENKETAEAEYETTTDDPDQPTLTFRGRLIALSVIDLENPAVFKKLKLADEDLTGSFRLTELNIQRLGQALAAQKKIAAIRYPSRAMNEASKSGFNYAIFPDAIAAPASLSIYGQKKSVLESWPKPSLP